MSGVTDDAQAESDRPGRGHPGHDAGDGRAGELDPVARAADATDDGGGAAGEPVDPGILEAGRQLAHHLEHGVDERAFPAGLDLVHLRPDAGAPALGTWITG